MTFRPRTADILPVSHSSLPWLPLSINILRGKR
jgi:hypothetical protein